MMPLVELQRRDAIVTRHLGHFNSHITWAMDHGHGGVGHIADMLASRDGSAVQKMTGMRPTFDRTDEWMPLLERAVLAMLEEIDAR